MDKKAKQMEEMACKKLFRGVNVLLKQWLQLLTQHKPKTSSFWQYRLTNSHWWLRVFLLAGPVCANLGLNLNFFSFSSASVNNSQNSCFLVAPGLIAHFLTWLTGQEPATQVKKNDLWIELLLPNSLSRSVEAHTIVWCYSIIIQKRTMKCVFINTSVLTLCFVSSLPLQFQVPDARVENRERLCLKASTCSYPPMSSSVERYPLQS